MQCVGERRGEREKDHSGITQLISLSRLIIINDSSVEELAARVQKLVHYPGSYYHACFVSTVIHHTGTRPSQLPLDKKKGVDRPIAVLFTGMTE